MLFLYYNGRERKSEGKTDRRRKRKRKRKKIKRKGKKKKDISIFKLFINIFIIFRVISFNVQG